MTITTMSPRVQDHDDRDHDDHDHDVLHVARQFDAAAYAAADPQHCLRRS
jgi:hypothetical protein